MMEFTFVCELGNVDTHGDQLLPTAFKDLPKRVIMLREFDVHNPIGFADVFIEDGVVKATANIEGDDMRLIPALGFTSVIETKESNKRVIHEAKLWCVGLSLTPNADLSIMPISIPKPQ